MNILLDDKEVALRDVSVGLRETADWLEGEDVDLNDGQVRNWSRKLQEHAREWDDYLRQHELLPTRPDPERETAVRILHKFAAVLDLEGTEQALTERLKQRLVALDKLLEQAQRSAPDDEGRRLLRQMQDSVSRLDASV